MKPTVVKIYLSLFIFPFILMGCGQTIGYHEVDNEMRYYHREEPAWLPSAAGPTKTFTRLGAVNRSTFEVKGYIAKDDSNVWAFGEKIPGADPRSFELLEGQYQRDKNKAYYSGKVLQDLNSDFFEVIRLDSLYQDITYARSDDEVYFTNKPLNVSSAKNFEFIDGYNVWGRDGFNYFMENQKIERGSYHEIEIINGYFLKDKSTVFSWDGETLSINEGNGSGQPALDIESLEKTELTGMYLKDKYGYINLATKKRASKEEYEKEYKLYADYH
ncbi:MAG: DKNYY domain-containing protein [Enterobacterales bacterium]|nr:DKNYY domain-containing protein [Enterobacterales bacterium]